MAKDNPIPAAKPLQKEPECGISTHARRSPRGFLHTFDDNITDEMELRFDDRMVDIGFDDLFIDENELDNWMKNVLSWVND